MLTSILILAFVMLAACSMTSMASAGSPTQAEADWRELAAIRDRLRPIMEGDDAFLMVYDRFNRPDIKTRQGQEKLVKIREFYVGGQANEVLNAIGEMSERYGVTEVLDLQRAIFEPLGGNGSDKVEALAEELGGYPDRWLGEFVETINTAGGAAHELIMGEIENVNQMFETYSTFPPEDRAAALAREVEPILAGLEVVATYRNEVPELRQRLEDFRQESAELFEKMVREARFPDGYAKLDSGANAAEMAKIAARMYEEYERRRAPDLNVRVLGAVVITDWHVIKRNAMEDPVQYGVEFALAVTDDEISQQGMIYIDTAILSAQESRDPKAELPFVRVWASGRGGKMLLENFKGHAAEKAAPR